MEEYFKKRKQQGFNFIQIQLLADNYQLKNTEGQHPLNGTLDLNNRNGNFFKHVEWIIFKAGKMGMAVMIAPAWLSCCVPGWHNGLKINGVAKAKAFGRFLGSHRLIHSRFNPIKIVRTDSPASVMTNMVWWSSGLQRSFQLPGKDRREKPILKVRSIIRTRLT